MPQVVPFGEEILQNSDKALIVNQTVTSYEKSTKAELHENFIDVFIVLEGKEELYIGGEITDKTEISPG